MFLRFCGWQHFRSSTPCLTFYHSVLQQVLSSQLEESTDGSLQGHEFEMTHCEWITVNLILLWLCNHVYIGFKYVCHNTHFKCCTPSLMLSHVTFTVSLCWHRAASLWQVNLKEQGQLIRQDEFLVSFRKKKCYRHIFLFQDLILFSKTKKTEVGNDVYVYKQSFKVPWRKTLTIQASCVSHYSSLRTPSKPANEFIIPHGRVIYRCHLFSFSCLESDIRHRNDP